MVWKIEINDAYPSVRRCQEEIAVIAIERDDHASLLASHPDDFVIGEFAESLALQ